MESNQGTTEDHGQEKGVAEETTKAETSASAAAGGDAAAVEEDGEKVTDADIAASIRRDLERARQGLPVDKHKRTTDDNGDGAAKRNKREYLAFHGTKHTRAGNDYQVDLSKLPVPEPAAAAAAAVPETDPSPAEEPPQPLLAVPLQEDNEEQKKTDGGE